MSKKNIVVAVVVVLVVVGVAFWVKKVKINSSNAYSVVYLRTGEVYIGKLSTFPDLELTNGYILQTTKDEKDPTKSNFQIQPINEVLWASQTLHLIKDNVVFYGPLLPTSKIAQTLATQGK